MAKTVNKLDVIGSQSFHIEIKGLNVYTKLNVYYDNTLVDPANLQDYKASQDTITAYLTASQGVSTDANGNASFMFYLPNVYNDLNGKPEAELVNYVSRDAGAKTVVVVDAASISANTLPDNYAVLARCYAQTVIRKSFDVQFTDVKDWGNIQGLSIDNQSVTQTSTPYTQTFSN